MAAEMQVVAQLLQATLDPRQHKQGLFFFGKSMGLLKLLTG
jgi:hypothetical protein